MNKSGVIYILTNPSFPEYVKIGYADDIEKRLQQLNRSECTPFAFRVYATYETPSRLSDLKIHSIIDKLNPDLRSIDNVKGQKRIREFYAMSAEDAYAILEAIAEIHDCTDKLKLIEPNEEEKADEAVAEMVQEERRARAERFSFFKCEIPVGAEIQYCDDPTIVCTVVDDRHVEYKGETMSLSALARQLSGVKHSVAGPRYFKYKGEWLNDVRDRCGY